MTWMQFVLPLLLSAFTGWFVIWLTIKLLFRPVKPVLFAGFKIQGIIPANQKQVAEKIGKLVSTDLFSLSSLQEKATSPENFNRLKPEIEKHIDQFLRVRLKETFPMLSSMIGDKTINQLKSAFLLELESLFPLLIKNYITTLEKDINPEKEVADMISRYPISRLEATLNKSAGHFLLKLQLMGAVIGLLTGLLQIFITTQVFN